MSHAVAVSMSAGGPHVVVHPLHKSGIGMQSGTITYWTAPRKRSQVPIRDTDMQRKQARWHGMRGVLRIPPLIHAQQREALLHTRIHILRHVMQVCRDQDDLPRFCLCKLCLPTLQLAEGMQFTDEALATGP